MLRSLAQIAPKRAAPSPASSNQFALVRHATRLQDVERVEQHLPEILGRALARSWIDTGFSAAFLADPKGLLAQYEVFLPDAVTLDVDTNEAERPRVIVYENQGSGRRRRLMFLQLAMLAGR